MLINKFNINGLGFNKASHNPHKYVMLFFWLVCLFVLGTAELSDLIWQNGPFMFLHLILLTLLSCQPYCGCTVSDVPISMSVT